MKMYNEDTYADNKLDIFHESFLRLVDKLLRNKNDKIRFRQRIRPKINNLKINF